MDMLELEYECFLCKSNYQNRKSVRYLKNEKNIVPLPWEYMP